MTFSDLTILLPCHSLEDFPTYHEGPQADELLAAWCAAWHPALIAAAGAVPYWHRVDMPPETLSGRLLVVPPFCADQLPAGFAARVSAEGGHLVREKSRDAAIAAALAGSDTGDAGIDAELANDFIALGFCRLQVELLTRQMRYSMHVDETHFNQTTIAAATAAANHDLEAARAHLQQCFDTLYEARKHFYPVDVFLLDITLLAETTLGDTLRRELDSDTPKNLLGPASLLPTLAADVTVWASLLAAIDRAAACVLGNELCETELPLVPLETARASLAAGADRYEQLLGRRPQVFARRRFGLWPALPQLLTRLGYQGAVHCTLDDGRFPLATQCKSRWQGMDANAIDIFARVPLDATRPESFLGYSRKMADSMDSDHVATLAFAHWPGQRSVWYDDLRRVARWSPVLGKFTLLDDYFSHTDMPGRISKFEADEYHSPYLKQAIIHGQSDPISRHVTQHREQAASAALEAVSALAALATGQASGSEAQRDSTSANVSQAVTRFAAALPRATASTNVVGLLVVNPLSFSRKIAVDLPQAAHAPQIKPPVVAAGSDQGRSVAVVDVPGMGFAWIAPGKEGQSPSRGKPIAKDKTLRNEFFEVTISHSTGGIASIYSDRQRGNQLSQQLGFRLPGDSAQEPTYSLMRAESVDIASTSPAFGEIVSRGTLVGADEQRIATFRQTTQVWAGSRTIRLDIELSDLEEPRADPWNSYYAARFAWPDEMAQLARGVGLGRQATEATRFEAPEYVEIASGSARTTILTGGLPYHARAGARMLDTLLVVRGETARRFSLGIGVNLPNPAAAAVEFVTPTTADATAAGALAAASGWFFHLDARNVVATHWRPTFDTLDSSAEAVPSGPRLRGFRARFLETDGRPGRVTLRTFRGVAAARQVDFAGQPLLELPIENDKIVLDFAEHEWIEVDAVFAH